MALHLVTGYKGSAHVTAADQGMFNAWCVGSDEYVLASGNKFNASIVSNNSVKIDSGSLLMQGRHVISDAPQNMSITNGTTNERRHDLIVMRYTKQGTGVESVSLVVITGSAEDTEDPEDPTYNTGSILSGNTTHDMPLYRVVLEGLSITRIEPLFRMLAPMADIQHGFYKQNLLINGDFKCNQRGKKSYESSGTTSAQYSVDMWRIHQVKLEVQLEGIKITGKNVNGVGYLTQFIQLGKLKTTTYTISAMVDNAVYNFTVTPGGSAKEQDFGNFKISALTTSTWDNDLGDYDNKLKINFCPVGAASMVIKYIDVFEGSVAYPHVKEDYATALMRCRQYIQKGCYVSPVLAEVAGKYKFAICHDKLSYTGLAKPILESYTWSYTDTEGDTASGTVSTPTSNPTSLEGMFVVSIAGSYAIDSNYPAVKGTYVVSCEHLPNGD